MAVQPLGTIAEIEQWAPISQSVLPLRVARGIRSFARRKPLGTFCGLVILFFFIISDFVPESANKIASTVGLGTPVPYLADFLADNLPFVYPYDQHHLRDRLEGPSSTHLLGTDNLGQDILSRIIYGARTALVVSVGAMLISVLIQTLINLPAAYYGGWYDKLAYRLVDIADSLPNLIILMVILGMFGSGLWQMVILIGILLGFGGRYVRGQAYSIMAQPYIESARMIGAGDIRIMYRHVLPSLVPILITTATGRLGSIVLIEATLSFLGYGLPPPFPSWGQMLASEGRQFMRVAPGMALFPGLAITLLVFSFNMWGDAVRDVLDPRLRGSR